MNQEALVRNCGDCEGTSIITSKCSDLRRRNLDAKQYVYVYLKQASMRAYGQTRIATSH